MLKMAIAHIIGAGPSLIHSHPQIDTDGITYACNSAIGFYPSATYHVCIDADCANWNYMHIARESATIPLYHTALIKSLSRNPKLFLEWTDRIIPFSQNHLMDIKRTDIITRGCTVAIAAVHFAIIHGHNPIYLYGCDCSLQVLPCGSFARYWFDMPDQVLIKRRDRSNVSRYGKLKDGFYRDFHNDRFLKHWELLAEQAREMGVTIINKSGGCLNSFPRE